MNALEARLTYAVSGSGCWLFDGCTDEHGYGRLGIDGRSRRAHRLAYTAWVGPIPDSLQVDHECHNTDPTCAGGRDCEHRRCINPAHLMLVTPGQNVLNGKGIAATFARRTACKNGHEYTPENTRWAATPTGKTRICRTCRRISQRKAAA